MKNKVNILFVYLFVSIILFAFYCIFYFALNSYNDLRNIHVFYSLSVFFIIFILKESYYLLLAISSFIFAINLPFLEMIGWYSMPEGNKILLGDGIKEVIPLDVLSRTYFIHSVLLFSLLIAATLDKFFLRKCYINVKLPQKFIVSIIFITVWIVVMYYNSIIFYSSLSLGYVEVMHKHSVDIGVGLIGKTFDTLYQAIGALFIYGSANSKIFIKRSLIFLTPFLLQIAAGARGETIAVLITLIFIYNYYYSKIKVQTALISSVFGFLALTIIGMLRFETRFTDLSEFGIANIIVIGLVSASSSIAVLSYTIIKMSYFTNSVPFLFGYVQGIFSFAPNYTVEGIESKSYLAQHLTYTLNPAKLFHGSTIGSAMSAEVYELFNGSIILMIICMLIIYLAVGKVVKNMYKSPVVFYFGFQLLQFVWLSPRGSVMKVFSKELILGIVFIKLLELTLYSFKKRL